MSSRRREIVSVGAARTGRWWAGGAGDAARAGVAVFLDLNRYSARDAGGYAFVVDRGSYHLSGVMPDGGVVVSKVRVGQGRVVTRDVGYR